MAGKIHIEMETIEAQKNEAVPYEESHLYKLRHSAAHLMAQAFTELYPGVKLTIGPPIENGFYYDAEFPEPLKEEDLKKIEKKMKELAKLDQKFTLLKATDREDAIKIIKEQCSMGQGEEVINYKLELLDAIPEGDEITFYVNEATDRQGNHHKFVDLCRGPHIESTKEIKNFKLLSIAGAYWRGDVKNKQLTRVYGTAFPTKDELHQYLHNLEEAKKRDHRVLGKQLGLFMFTNSVGTGLPLWLPKGATLRDTMCDFLKKEQLKAGYEPVVTPNIASSRLYEKSGHIITFKEKMFPFMHDDEKETFILKPMNCPFHVEIYASTLRSYRDLPVRLAEFGTVYRYEQSGEVAGILRVRGFTQDDAHLFVTPDQLLEEFKGVAEITMKVLNKLGLKNYWARLGTRGEGEKYIGSDENWDLAENAIREACKQMNMDFKESPGDAAFYGPKLDLIIKDALGREWQMGTIQVDYNLPERFELEYIGEDGERHRPIMIHRAPFGSLERMVGLLTEHYAGAFPLWLAPVQVAILPIADRHQDYAAALAEALQGYKPHGFKPIGEIPVPEIDTKSNNSIRVHVDNRRETLGKKIRENQLQKIPYMLVVGDQEIENKTVGVRSRNEGDLGTMSFTDFIAKIDSELE